MLLKIGGALFGALVASVTSILALGFGDCVTRPKAVLWPVFRKRWRMLVLIVAIDLVLSGLVVGQLIGVALSCSCFKPGNPWIVPAELVPYVLGGAIGVFGFGLVPDCDFFKRLRNSTLEGEDKSSGAESAREAHLESKSEEASRETAVKNLTKAFSGEISGELAAMDRAHRRWRRAYITSVREAVESEMRSIKAGWHNQLEMAWASYGKRHPQIMFTLISQCSRQSGPQWAKASVKAKGAMERLSEAAKTFGKATQDYALSEKCLNLEEQADPVFEALLNLEQYDFLADRLAIKLLWSQ